MALVSPSLLEAKRALRLAMGERRKALPPQERARCSHQATARLLALPELATFAHGPPVVAGFSALPAEIDPALALAALRQRGVEVALPRVTAASPRLRFHRAGADELRPGPFGILEPADSCPEVAAEQIDLFLVPGLAFDGAGRRLGFGGGYYDELAPAVRAGGRGVLIGLGFDFQVVERCPAGEGDARLDAVVTDARVLRPTEGGA
jgi:5-formyltetrahydrofolate cyclo-ligase